MTAKEIFLSERARPAPNWTHTRGVYGNYTDWPAHVEFYAKCPKCGQVHGNYRTMKEAHAKRLCDRCNVDAINNLKDYIARVDDPDQRNKKSKSTSRMFNEADEEFPEDDIDPETEIRKALTDNWIAASVFQLTDEQGIEFKPYQGSDYGDPDVDTKVTLTGEDHSEWVIYKNEDEAETEALAQVKEMLDTEPESFEENFIRGHINQERLKRDLLVDRDWRTEFDETHDDDEEKKVRALIFGGYLDEDEFFGARGLKKITPKREKLINTAIDAWIEKQEEDFDPMDYLEDIYGKKDCMKEAIKIGGIDTSAAAEEAVRLDGWSHFLAHYDGNSHDLGNGAVAIRVD